MTPSRLDTQLSLKHLGIDSLTAMELRRKVELDLGIVLPVVQRWMDLLAQVPEVSDDDVDELLREILAAREGQDGRPLGWARDPL